MEDPSYFLKQIGYAIKIHRRALNLSQSAVAREAGTTQGAVARLEAGLGNPTYQTLARIAEACNKRLVVEFVPRKRKY